MAKRNGERQDRTAQSAPNGFRRIAWLLRALRDPDESVRDWKNCRRPYFSDFICSAIRESGFVDPIVARYAIYSGAFDFINGDRVSTFPLAHIIIDLSQNLPEVHTVF